MVLQFFAVSSSPQMRGGGSGASGAGGGGIGSAATSDPHGAHGGGVAGFAQDAMGAASRVSRKAREAVSLVAQKPKLAGSASAWTSSGVGGGEVLMGGAASAAAAAASSPSSPSSADAVIFSPGSIVVVFGTRPEAVKLLPVLQALRLQAGATPAVVAVNTGQHDDLLHKTLESLSTGTTGAAPALIDIDLNLGGAGAGAGSPAATIAAVLSALSPAFAASLPALVIVQGDTTTAAAAALAAHLAGVPVAHVEAGLRSFSGMTPFPEEFYRTTIAAAAVLHFAPTHHAARSLAAQGNVRGRVHVVGNPGVDGTRAQLVRLKTLDGGASPAPTLAAALAGASLVLRLAFVPDLAVVSLAALDGVIPKGNTYFPKVAVHGGMEEAISAVEVVGALPVYAKLCNPWCAGNTGVSELPTCLQHDVQIAVAAADAKKPGLITDVWIVLTMHRRESFGAPFERLARAVGDLVDDFYPNLHIVWPMHPNPAVAAGMREGLRGLGDAHVDGVGAAGAAHTATAADVLPGDDSERSAHLRSNLHVLEPLPAEEVTALLLVADAVVTDSGGLQEEAVTLGKHVFVLRETTERPEALASGLMHIVGTDPEALRLAVKTWIEKRCEVRLQAGARAARTYGDGLSGARIAEIALAVVDATKVGAPGSLVPDGQYADPFFAAAAAAVRKPTVSLNAPFVGDVAAKFDFTAIPENLTAAVEEDDLVAVGEEEEVGVDLELGAVDYGADELTVPGEGEGVVDDDKSVTAETAPVVGRRLIESRSKKKRAAAHAAMAIAWAEGTNVVVEAKASVFLPTPKAASRISAASSLLAATSAHSVPLAHERFMRPLQCSAQPADTGIDSLGAKEELYGDVMGAESDYDINIHAGSESDPLLALDFTYTAIVGAFRRMKFLARMIEALLAQSHPPFEIWVTSFASPHLAQLEAITKSFQNATSKVKWLGGDPQLKYFGRMQVAAQASTTHVAFFDDDCIPGSNAVTNAFHMMYLKSRRYYGLIGMKGHWAPVEAKLTHIQQPYHITWEYRPPMAKEVDLTGGMWFLRRDWLHTMFRDNAFTLETGEDFQLTYALKKYMGECPKAGARSARRSVNVNT